MSVCYLVGGGVFTKRGLQPQDGDYVIAADSGFLHLKEQGMIPDLLVGDFDSLKERPEGIARIEYPPEKDDTDMAIAIAEGRKLGYSTFCMYGASGGRADHTYANLQHLAGGSKLGLHFTMVCPTYDVYALTNGKLTLPIQEQGTTISIFCSGNNALGVTLEGMKYPLKNATLTADIPLGVSNAAIGSKCSVEVNDGTLLIFVMHGGLQGMDTMASVGARWSNIES